MRKLRSKLAAGAAIGGAAIGGAAIANAATSPSTTSSTSTTTPTPAQTHPGFPAHGTAAHEDAEKPVTGTAAAKARAAAVKTVGGGTAGPVTTDFTGSGYETTVAEDRRQQGRGPSRQRVQGHAGQLRGSWRPGTSRRPQRAGW